LCVRKAGGKTVTNTFIVFRMVVKLLMMFDGRLFSVKEPVQSCRGREGVELFLILLLYERNWLVENPFTVHLHFLGLMFLYVLFCIRLIKEAYNGGAFPYAFLFFEVNKTFYEI
jgi:hypothetical protein